MDSNGQEQAGTRTPPGTTPTNCDNPGKGQNVNNVHIYSVEIIFLKSYLLHVQFEGNTYIINADEAILL